MASRELRKGVMVGCRDVEGEGGDLMGRRERRAAVRENEGALSGLFP
jgi:hypothetical protein